MSDKVLDEIASKHLPYEISQLRGTFNQLKEMEKAGPVDAADVARLVIHNSLIESFCVHARSLINFFANCRARKTDIIAEEFGPFAASLEPEKEPLQGLRTKLNKQIFHLTRDRTVLASKKFDLKTDGVKILRMIDQEVERFKALRQLECKIPPVAAPSLAFQTHTTSFIETPTGRII